MFVSAMPVSSLMTPALFINGVVKAADRLVAIDGCPVQCAKKTLEHAGFDVDVAVTVTDLEIGKKTGFSMEQDDVNKVIDAVSVRIN